MANLLNPRSFFLALPIVAGLLGSVAAEPVRRALIVGVSDYPKESVGDFQLAGPRNDVALLLHTLPLIGIKPDHMTVLADGLEQTDAPRQADGLPTRAAILAGLETLARDSKKDDFAMVYLSGHGSRQPDVTPEKRAVPKADGLDEMFLPIDIGVWDDGVSAVENALLDHDFAKAINKIRATGAHVWVVVDACHSGSMTRSVGEGVAKQVPMDRLKIPPDVIAKARAAAEARAARSPAKTRSTGENALKTRESWAISAEKAPNAPVSGPVGEGSYVAFFAAHPDQQALQEALPPGRGIPGRKPYSVMTWYLAQALRAGRIGSYRDLASQVLAGYEGFGKAPVPMFEGDLNRSVSETQGVEASARTYFARRSGEALSLEGGAADGLSAGAVLALALAEKPEETIAYAEIAEAGLARSGLQPVVRDGKETRLEAIPKDTALIASVIEKGVDLRFSIAISMPNTPTSVGEKAFSAVISEKMPLNSGSVGLVTAPAEADVVFRIEDDRLWFVPKGGALEKTGRERTPSIPLGDVRDAPAAMRLIARHAARLAKTRNLVRTAQAMGAKPIAGKLRVEAFLLRDDRETPPGARAPDDRRCRPREAQVPPGATPLMAGALALPEIRHCDQVYFRLTNAGDKPLDITPLYVDGEGVVSYHGPHTGLRLEPKATPTVLSLNLRTFNPDKGAPEAIGMERLMFIAVEIPERQAVAADFRYLADPQLTRSAAGGPPALRAFLENAAFARPGTRSAVSAPAPGDGAAAGVVEYRWRVVAPEGAQ